MYQNICFLNGLILWWINWKTDQAPGIGPEEKKKLFFARPVKGFWTTKYKVFMCDKSLTQFNFRHPQREKGRISKHWCS